MVVTSAVSMQGIPQFPKKAGPRYHAQQDSRLLVASTAGRAASGEAASCVLPRRRAIRYGLVQEKIEARRRVEPHVKPAVSFTHSCAAIHSVHMAFQDGLSRQGQVFFSQFA